MKRKDALLALRACGSSNDRQGWMRIYVENKISLPVANQAWRDGQNLRQFCETRDAGK